MRVLLAIPLRFSGFVLCRFAAFLRLLVRSVAFLYVADFQYFIKIKMYLFCIFILSFQ